MWVRGGGDLYKLQKIGGRKSFSMVQRYAHLAPDAYSGDFGRLGTGPSVEGTLVRADFRKSEMAAASAKCSEVDRPNSVLS